MRGHFGGGVKCKYRPISGYPRLAKGRRAGDRRPKEAIEACGGGRLEPETGFLLLLPRHCDLIMNTFKITVVPAQFLVEDEFDRTAL
jgi:hypothetical protein